MKDRVSNPRLLTYESGALPAALPGPASAEVLGHKTPLLFHLSQMENVGY